MERLLHVVQAVDRLDDDEGRGGPAGQDGDVVQVSKGSSGVSVKTDGDSYASLEHERVLIEFSKDGDSPNCPRSWTWGLWLDGEPIDGVCNEASLAASVKEATKSITEIIAELAAMRDYLMAYGAFGREPE